MLKRLPVILIACLALALSALAAKKQMDSGLYVDQPTEKAASNLLQRAEMLAKDGSYELLAVARLYVLSGDRTGGQQLIDRVLAGKAGPSEWVRIGRIYLEAGSWEEARPYFDRALQAKPDDEDWLAEIGACYVLNGDRAHGEELLGRSFAEDPENVRNTLRAAAAYLGLSPE